MSLESKSYSRWAAPFVGAVFGLIVGSRLAWNDYDVQDSQFWVVVAVCVAACSAVGLLVLVFDPPLRRSKLVDHGEILVYEETDGPDPDEASLVGRVLTFFALLLFIFPVMGTILAGVAMAVNRKRIGWPRRGAKLAMFLSLPTTLIVVIGLIGKGLGG